jgi:hypothetical protein
MDINWTTIIASAITAAIIGSTQFIATRYLGRILDRLEKGYEKSTGDKSSDEKISPRS